MCALGGAGCVLGTRQDHSPMLWSMSLAWWMGAATEGSRTSCMPPDWQGAALQPLGRADEQSQPLVRRKRKDYSCAEFRADSALHGWCFPKRLFVSPLSLLLASVVRCG